MRRLGLLFLSFLCVVLIAAAVGFRAQPTSFRIARTRTIPASPRELRASLEDLRTFAALLPKRTGAQAQAQSQSQSQSLAQAQSQVTFSPQPSGVGAWFESRDERGASRTSLVVATDSRIELKTQTSGSLFNGSSRTLIELSPSPESSPERTSVTWVLEGELSGLRRALWPFISLDRMVGPDLAEGLSRLEATVVQARKK